tara:strand:- start:186 stop:461 length:276 start_codon:yes stop_codon:yes gene_type:complete
MLRAYRRVRDAYVDEVMTHNLNKESVAELNRRITLCTELGNYRLDKMSKLRLRQDEILENWKNLERVHKKKKKEVSERASEPCDRRVSASG